MAIKTVFIGVRISKGEKAQLDTLVERQRVNQSEVLRRLIRRGMTGKESGIARVEKPQEATE